MHDPEKPSQAGRKLARTPALLKGSDLRRGGYCRIADPYSAQGRLYRYYINQRVIKTGAPGNSATRVPAGEIEEIVIGQLRRMIASPEIIVAT